MGAKDYWATPGQLFLKFCDREDYAIVKFLSLLALDVPSEIMRIVIAKDLNLKAGHAILATEIKGKQYLLDNQIKRIVPATKVRHYKPIFSLNELGWWLHRPAKKKRRKRTDLPVQNKQASADRQTPVLCITTIRLQTAGL